MAHGAMAHGNGIGTVVIGAVAPRGSRACRVFFFVPVLLLVFGSGGDKVKYACITYVIYAVLCSCTLAAHMYCDACYVANTFAMELGWGGVGWG